VLPLRRPYVLSFGVLHQLDSFVAIAHFADGSLGLGESCPLPGYSHETAEMLAAEYAALARSGDCAAFLARNRDNPFVTAPVLTCLEAPAQALSTTAIPICPILQWDHIEEIPECVARLAAAGNHVAKVKITADLGEAHAVIQMLQPCGASAGLRFRYDANQALTLPQAESVAEWLDHPTTELLEQPLPVEAWDAMARLYQQCRIPLMLDEAIVDLDTVERAAGCAHLIKLKLAKNGSPRRLHELIRRARALGMDVVLGNGVQGTLGCWLEAQVQHEAGLTRAGEMNGFRKLHRDPLAFLLVDHGATIAPSASLDLARIPDLLRGHARVEYRVRLRQAAA
jgi:O-succinylbenzoate synthase